MKYLFIKLIITVAWLLNYTSISAQEPSMAQNKSSSQRTLHQGYDEIKPNEYINIDRQGGITRSACPYTCADRGLAKENCKTWTSKINSNECYVQDTRIKTDAVQQ